MQVSLASRLNVTKENSKKYHFRTFLLFDEFRGGGVEKGKRYPNEPKVIFLLIKHSFRNICARSGPPQLGVVLV